MLKVISKIYLFKDSYGNKSFASCEDGSDTIQICGMVDKSGETQHFESEAYHAELFCNDYDIEKRVIVREEDFDTLWETAPEEK